MTHSLCIQIISPPVPAERRFNPIMNQMQSKLLIKLMMIKLMSKLRPKLRHKLRRSKLKFKRM